MCGISVAFGKKAVARAMQQYSKQKTRGQSGFGFLSMKDGKVDTFKRSAGEGPILAEIAKVRGADAFLFHHRYPTSTKNLPLAAHPIPLKHGKNWAHTYYILHNGVITDAAKHEDLVRDTGYVFGTQIDKVEYYRSGKSVYEYTTESDVNDSEILGYYIAEYLEGKRVDIPLYGAIAAIVVQKSRDGSCRVFAMRNNGNPLKVHREDGTMLISSEGPGIMLEAGGIFEIKDGKCELRHIVDIGNSYQHAVKYAKPIYPYNTRADDYDYGHRSIGFGGSKDKTSTETALPLALPVAPQTQSSAANSVELEIVTDALEDARKKERETWEDYCQARLVADNEPNDEYGSYYDNDPALLGLFSRWTDAYEEYRALLDEANMVDAELARVERTLYAAR